jgi:integrase/recombinase XerD
MLIMTAQAQLTAAKSPSKKRAAWLDLVLAQTGLLMGLRVSELCKLLIEQLDMLQATGLIFEAKGGKDRYVPIPGKLLGPLAAWIGARTTGFVFASPRGGKLASRTVQARMEVLGRKAGLLRKLKPHTFRHTYACRLIESGAGIHEVSELLGHAGIGITSNYLHCIPERLRAAVERL